MWISTSCCPHVVLHKMSSLSGHPQVFIHKWSSTMVLHKWSSISVPPQVVIHKYISSCGRDLGCSKVWQVKIFRWSEIIQSAPVFYFLSDHTCPMSSSEHHQVNLNSTKGHDKYFKWENVVNNLSYVYNVYCVQDCAVLYCNKLQCSELNCTDERKFIMKLK